MNSATKKAERIHRNELNKTELKELEACANIIRAARVGIVEHNLEIGDALRRAQAILANHGDGEFTEWLKAEFDMSRSTAYNYLQIAAAVPAKVRPIVGRSFDMGALIELTSPKAPKGALAAAIKMARRDKRITMAVATKLIRKLEAKERAAKVVESSDDNNIHLCEMGDLPVQPASGDLIITDLPYGKEFLGLAASLAELSAKWLRPGGLLIAYSGVLYLPEVLRNMEQHLQWLHPICVLHKGNGSPQPLEGSRMIQGWKPALMFCKPPLDSWWEPGSDVLTCGERDKKFHEWGQSLEEARELIRRFCPVGGLVIDCACGGGTVPVAALIEGRRFIAGDIDAEAVRTARQRIDLARKEAA